MSLALIYQMPESLKTSIKCEQMRKIRNSCREKLNWASFLLILRSCHLLVVHPRISVLCSHFRECAGFALLLGENAVIFQMQTPWISQLWVSHQFPARAGILSIRWTSPLSWGGRAPTAKEGWQNRPGGIPKPRVWYEQSFRAQGTVSRKPLWKGES